MPQFTRTDAPNPIVNSYKTKDGRWLFLNMLQPDRFWPDLCRRIGRPELIEDERFANGMARFMNRVECVRMLDAVFAARTLDEWRAALADAEGVWAPMQTRHRAARRSAGERQRLSAADRPRRRQSVHAGRQPGAVRRDQPPTLRPAPDLGQHTEEVLLELGMTWDDLARYKEAGAIS